MITFQDSTLADAVTNGCDTVQIKHEGVFAQFFPHTGRVLLQSHRDTPHDLQHCPAQPGLNPTLIGTYSPITATLVVFDCWHIEEPPDNMIDLCREPYRSRYVATRIQLKLMQHPVKLVQNHPIQAAQHLWSTLPDVPGAKGLVFRNSKDPVGVHVRRAQWYPELPGALV